MATVFLVLVVVLVVAALVLGVVTLLAGDDPGLSTAEPDGRARPLPNNRSLAESDLKDVRFDVTLRGYRMAQVDRVLRRTAYDLGYKDEMIAVLEAEVAALRDGRTEDAELLRKARESASNPAPSVITEEASSLAPTSDFAPSDRRSSDVPPSNFAKQTHPPVVYPDSTSDAFDPTAPGTLAPRTSDPATAADDSADQPAPEQAAHGPASTESDQEPAERSARA